jgi:hypothetical protein
MSNAPYVPTDKFGNALATAFTRNVGPKLDGELISNALLARTELLSTLLDPRRDINAECHYPATQDVSPESYKDLYARDPIACRVVQCIAKESWQVQPTVYECEDEEITTPFEEAWDALQPMTNGVSWYKSEEGGSVWEYLLRADILSGIGHFGVLLMGFDDGKNLQEPVEGAMVTNFDPEQPRNDEGQFVDMYHGTSPEKAKKIREVGYLKPAEGSDIYLTKNPEYAKTYGTEVFHVRVPQSSLSRVDFESGIGSGGLSDEDKQQLDYASEYTYRGDKLSITPQRKTVVIHGIRHVVNSLMMNAGPTHRFTPDCYLTESEEANLRKLPNLNSVESRVLDQLARQRQFIVNALEREDQQRRGTAVFGEATGERDYEDRTSGVQGTDKQYSQEFGLQGEARYDPGLSGTDQQYFGVQFGPSEQPVKQPSKKKLRLLFLRPYDESLVQVVRYEWSVNNPRFGQPVMYRITLNDPREQHSGIGLPMATVFVHWSRVLHLADNLNSSEIFGAPRMRPVLNRLIDLQKIYGASAEGYWQAAFTGLSLETHPQLGGDVTIDKADVRNQIENYVNSLQRYLALTGMSAKTLAPQVSDPSNQIDKHLEAICIQLGIPKRIFMGSERGELASSQDDASWNDRLKARQQGYITPRIIVPFVDRLIAVGVLPEPNYVEPVEEDPFSEEQFDGEQFGDDQPYSPGGPGGAGSMDDDDTGYSLESEPGAAGEPEESPQDGDEDAGDDQGDADEENLARLGLTKNALTDQFDEGQELPVASIMEDPVTIKTKTGYTVSWPDLDSNTDLSKAQIASTKTQALAAYVSGNVESVMPLMEFYTKILGFPEEEAVLLVKAAEEQQLEQQQEQAEQQMAQIPQMPDGSQGSGMVGGDEGGQANFNDQRAGEEPQRPFDHGVGNAYCSTGEGGGVDPSCSPGSSQGKTGKVLSLWRGGEAPVGDRPIFMTTSKSGAAEYGEPSKYNVTISNPLKLKSTGFDPTLIRIAESAGVKFDRPYGPEEVYSEELADAGEAAGLYADREELARHLPNLIYIPKVREALQQAGYDALEFDDELYGGHIKTYALFGSKVLTKNIHCPTGKVGLASFPFDDDVENVSGEQWITVKGTHVKVDDSGKIESGPAGLKGEKSGRPTVAATDHPETPEFKEWFGDSKVVDEEGKPLVVYHGTRSNFESFDKSKTGSRLDPGDWGQGFYFGDEDKAVGYGHDDPSWKTMPVYLSMRNPLLIVGDRNFDELSPDHPMVPVLSKMFGKDVVAKAVADGDGMPAFVYSIGHENFTRTLQKNGYDGVLRVFKPGSFEAVVFEPNQIKSATGNRGTFDPRDPIITHQKNC